MNKKGFTLVELLAVITILGILSSIIIVKVSDSIKKSKESLHKEQIDTLVRASKKYMVEHSEFLPDEDDAIGIVVHIDDLINNGIIDKESVIDPKTNKKLVGCVLVKYDQNYNQYDYEFSIDNNKCNME